MKKHLYILACGAARLTLVSLIFALVGVLLFGLVACVTYAPMVTGSVAAAAVFLTLSYFAGIDP
jgi:hypothetical protein